MLVVVIVVIVVVVILRVFFGVRGSCMGLKLVCSFFDGYFWCKCLFSCVRVIVYFSV